MTRREGRRALEIRAPKRLTVVICGILFAFGTLGVLDMFGMPDPIGIDDRLAVIALLLCGGGMIVAAFLRDL